MTKGSSEEVHAWLLRPNWLVQKKRNNQLFIVQSRIQSQRNSRSADEVEEANVENGSIDKQEEFVGFRIIEVVPSYAFTILPIFRIEATPNLCNTALTLLRFFGMSTKSSVSLSCFYFLFILNKRDVFRNFDNSRTHFMVSFAFLHSVRFFF